MRLDDKVPVRAFKPSGAHIEMVDITHFQQLPEIKEVKGRNLEVKRAFSPLSPAITIDGWEEQTICCLVHLRERAPALTDVFDKLGIKIVINDKKNINRWVKAFSFRHTHNIKYPDYRARGCIRMDPIGKIPEYLLSSQAIQPNSMGWSQNSADINFHYLLCSEFIWKRRLLCLGEALQQEIDTFVQALKSNGMSKENIKRLIDALKSVPSECRDVDFYSDGIHLLRFPNEYSEYTCITPVTSHKLQRKLHLLTRAHYWKAETMKASRPGSIGNLAASVGGRINALKTLPSRLDTSHIEKSDKRWLSDVNLSALRAMAELPKVLMTDNQLKQHTFEVKSGIEQLLSDWLSVTFKTDESLPSTKALVEKFNFALSKTHRARMYAYEPVLMRKFFSGFNQLRTNIVNGNLKHRAVQSTPSPIEKCFLVISNIKVDAANALSSPYTAGLPSLIGIFGFIHAYQRKLNIEFGNDIHFQSFAICLHNCSLHHRGLTRESIFAKDGKIKPPPIIDSLQCDMQLSLVVECQGPLPERTDLKAALPMSLCGGIVHLMSVEKNFTGHDLFIKAAEKVETQYGKWLTLDNAFNANELIHDPDRQRDILNRATFSCVGYHFLNPPTAIKDTLNGYPHALAENIIANIKCITIKNNIAFEKLLWRYSHFDNHLLIQTGKKYDAT